METKRLLLREFEVNDVHDVYEWGSDPKVSELMNFKTHQDLTESKYVIEEMLMLNGSLAIIKKDNNECIGSIGCIYDKDHNKVNLGYALKYKYWNQGYMSEAVDCVVADLFNNKFVNRVEVYIYADNIASKRVIEKCGFIEEGYLKQFYYHKGSYKDCFIFGLVASDYRKMKI
ncbi:ribosomal-protein-alanine N-acetyltransferase [Bacilli bacterium PM5-3]|nr:ribosomal-protein-alanine N-acetyltransferase [Bacilli bacterium PM5-3]